MEAQPGDGRGLDPEYRDDVITVAESGLFGELVRIDEMGPDGSILFVFSELTISDRARLRYAAVILRGGTEDDS